MECTQLPSPHMLRVPQACRRVQENGCRFGQPLPEFWKSVLYQFRTRFSKSLLLLYSQAAVTRTGANIITFKLNSVEIAHQPGIKTVIIGFLKIRKGQISRNYGRKTLL